MAKRSEGNPIEFRIVDLEFGIMTQSLLKIIIANENLHRISISQGYFYVSLYISTVKNQRIMIPKAIFLLLIPGTIYSVALIDLLRIFRSRKMHWEPLLWGVFLYVTVITNWINLYDDIGKFENGIFLYTMYMVGPLVFAQAVFVLSPENSDIDLKEHFLNARRRFFSLATFVLSYNLMFQYILQDSDRSLIRSVLIIAYGLNIFIDRAYIRITALVLSFIAAAAVYTLELF